MDSPLEACSVYLQHYEPYLKDPVGFPRVMVTSLSVVPLFVYQHVTVASEWKSSCYLMTILTGEDEFCQLASRCHCSSWNGIDQAVQTERKILRILTTSSDKLPVLAYVKSCHFHICTSELPLKWCGSLENSQMSSVARSGASVWSRASQIQPCSVWLLEARPHGVQRHVLSLGYLRVERPLRASPA